MSASWFGQPGGGWRYRTTWPVADLVVLGYLADITDQLPATTPRPESAPAASDPPEQGASRPSDTEPLDQSQPDQNEREGAAG